MEINTMKIRNKSMIIDEEILKNGITDKILAKLIARHTQAQEHYQKLGDYYFGNHAICTRQRKGDHLTNNKIVCNHAKYIVDITQRYLLENSVSYTCSEGYDIEAVKNSYMVQDIPSIDAELERTMSIYGKAYEMVYLDAESHVKSIVLVPYNTFIVYGSGVSEKPIVGIHYYKKHDIDGNVTGVCAIVCDETTIYTYEGNKDSFENMELTDKRRHYFGKLPMIEYRNNEEMQGDFEQLIPLIDAYNILESDRVNDKEQFVDAFLFLTGIDLDSAQAKKLKEERILMGYEGATAQYISKCLNETDTETLKKAIKDDIHQMSHIPILSNKHESMDFEHHLKNKAKYFSKGLRQRFELYVNFLSLKGAMEYVPIHRVNVEINTRI